jgi:chorismate dehydratase
VSPKTRLGSVNYLNCRPLVYGLGGENDPLFTLRFDPPSKCAALLEAGEIDLGLIPTIAYADRRGDCIVPGVAIASEGPVASVALFTRAPVSAIRSIALDTSSRTSVALTRILCARRFGIAPSFEPHAPDLPSMLAKHDAALLIGDPALLVDHKALGEDVEKMDLGQAWTDMTGLPFVWAFWSGRAGAASPEAVSRLQAAKRAGMRVSDALADDYVAGTPQYRALARQYLREHIKFDLGDRMLAGLRSYYREAASLGIIPTVPEPAFFAGEPVARS